MTAYASRAILLASLSAIAIAAPVAVHAQTPPATTSADAAEPATIIVTGTRRTDRTVADSPVPIDVISSDAITNTGATETNKILNQLVPSFNFPQPAISDGSDALRPATLRGLSPDQTLVLVNGKRRHVTALVNVNGTIGRGAAAVDLNLIPGLAISRIEVLRDGASSQYGSDAIAGVINVQLKKANRGGRASVTYGQYVTTLDGVPNVTGLALNSSGQPQFDPSDGRYLLATTDGERKARDGEQLTTGVNLGLPLGPRGYLNLTAEYRSRNATNRQAADLRPNYIRPTGAFDPREAGFDRLNFRYGDPRTRDYNFFVNTGYEFDGGWELYAFGSYGRRNAQSAANFRQQSNAGNRDFSTIAPNTSPNAANFVPLTSDGFLPKIGTVLNDYAGTVGVKGKVSDWTVDLSVGRARNIFDYRLSDTLNTSFGSASQREFNAGGLRYGQTLGNLDFSRSFGVGLAKPLAVAIGGELRGEDYQIRPGDVQSYAIGPLFVQPFATTPANCTTQQGVFNSATGICSFPGRVAGYGAQGFPGLPATSATDVRRNSHAVYVELDTDPIAGLTTTIAGRYERFSDFGSTVNGKFAARFEPFKGYAVRGSISNGFRAPSLQQQSFTAFSTNFVGGIPVDILTVAVNSPVAQALGSKPLKAEKSVNMSFGMTMNPLRGLTLTADVYKIKIKDRIVLTENLGAAGSGSAAQNAAVQAVLQGAGFPNIPAARFFINGLDTTTTGLDIVGAYRWRGGGMGSWTLTAAYNRNKTKINRRLNELGPLATVPGLVLFGRIEGIRFTDGQPRDKVVLSADGDIGRAGVTLRTTRYGRVISPGSAAPIASPTSLTEFGPDDIFLSPKWITDAEVRYKLGKLELALGANNLLDVYPDRSPFGPRPAAIGGAYPANQQYLPYSIFSPFGFNGRFLYGRVAVGF